MWRDRDRKRQFQRVRAAEARQRRSHERERPIVGGELQTAGVDHHGRPDGHREPSWLSGAARRSGSAFAKSHLPLSLIMLDLDDFKRYNDVFGHLEGDHVLKSIAAALCAQAREVDFVARYGGEEFVIILAETDAAGACEAAERFAP